MFHARYKFDAYSENLMGMLWTGIKQYPRKTSGGAVSNQFRHFPPLFSFCEVEAPSSLMIAFDLSDGGDRP